MRKGSDEKTSSERVSKLSKAAQLEGRAGVWASLSDATSQSVPSPPKFPKCRGRQGWGWGLKITASQWGRRGCVQASDREESLRVVPTGL